VLSWHLPGGAGANHKNLSGQEVSRPKLDSKKVKPKLDFRKVKKYIVSKLLYRKGNIMVGLSFMTINIHTQVPRRE
jgi:hypothetical protein